MRKLKYLIVLLILFAVNSKSYSQGDSCDIAQPFCTDSIYQFPTLVGDYTYTWDNHGINFGCLGSVINLSWFYLKISNPGDINIHIVINCDNGQPGDVDFAAWGPFDQTTCEPVDLSTNAENPNGTQQPDNTVEALWNFNTPHENMVDCGYSELGEENLFIPNTIVGQYYMVAVQNFGGCVGSINFQKTFGEGETDCTIVNPEDPTDIVAEVNSETICEGECADISATFTTEGTAPYTYAWSDNTLSGAGPHNVCPTSTTTYTVTITDGTGVSTTASGTVTINANPTTNIIGSSMCEGNSSTLDAGTGFDTYHWSTSETTQTIDIATTGTYSVTVTDNNNCVGDASITINTMSNPTPIISGDLAICNGSVSILDAGQYNTYLWSTSETTQTIEINNTGTYSVTVTDNNNCIGTHSVDIDVDIVEITTTPNQLICLNDTATIQVNVSSGVPTYTYYWNTNATMTSSIDVSPNIETTYNVYVIDNLGCKSNIESIKISHYLPVELDISSNKDSVCPGDPILISSTITNGIPPYILKNTDGNIIDLLECEYPLNNSTYIYTVEDKCNTISTDIVNVGLYKIPSLEFHSDILEGCPPLSVNFISNLDFYNDDFSYLWIFDGEDNKISFDKNPTQIFIKSGYYDISLKITTPNGCSNDKTIENMIYVFPTTIAKFDVLPSVVDIIEPSFDFVNYSIDGYKYIWSFDDGDSSDFVNPTHKYNNIGEYTVKLISISEKGCVDSVYHTVLVEDIFTLYVPSYFSPDGDDINDNFYVVGHGIDTDNFNMKIFNRWGEIIWQTNDLFAKWDGKYKNNICKNDSYVFLITCYDFNGVEYQKSGIINLIK